MGFLFDLLTLPALGGPRLVQWLATILDQEAEQEAMDEGRVGGALLELQARYEAGQLGEEEYDAEESVLLERLNTIRESKAERGGQRQLVSQTKEER